MGISPRRKEENAVPMKEDKRIPAGRDAHPGDVEK